MLYRVTSLLSKIFGGVLALSAISASLSWATETQVPACHTANANLLQNSQCDLYLQGYLDAMHDLSMPSSAGVPATEKNGILSGFEERALRTRLGRSDEVSATTERPCLPEGIDAQAVKADLAKQDGIAPSDVSLLELFNKYYPCR